MCVSALPVPCSTRTRTYTHHVTCTTQPYDRHGLAALLHAAQHCLRHHVLARSALVRVYVRVRVCVSMPARVCDLLCTQHTTHAPCVISHTSACHQSVCRTMCVHVCVRVRTLCTGPHASSMPPPSSWIPHNPLTHSYLHHYTVLSHSLVLPDAPVCVPWLQGWSVASVPSWLRVHGGAQSPRAAGRGPPVLCVWLQGCVSVCSVCLSRRRGGLGSL